MSHPPYNSLYLYTPRRTLELRLRQIDRALRKPMPLRIRDLIRELRRSAKAMLKHMRKNRYSNGAAFDHSVRLSP